MITMSNDGNGTTIINGLITRISDIQIQPKLTLMTATIFPIELRNEYDNNGLL